MRKSISSASKTKDWWHLIRSGLLQALSANKLRSALHILQSILHPSYAHTCLRLHPKQSTQISSLPPLPLPGTVPGTVWHKLIHWQPGPKDMPKTGQSAPRSTPKAAQQGSRHRATSPRLLNQWKLLPKCWIAVAVAVWRLNAGVDAPPALCITEMHCLSSQGGCTGSLHLPSQGGRAQDILDLGMVAC